MNQQFIHAYKSSHKRRYHKLRDDSCSRMVLKAPTKDRLPRTHSNEDQPDPRYAFPEPMASQLMYPRELYPERNEQPSHLQGEEREMPESPFERDCAERNDYDTIMDGRSSYHGQEEQRDRPEYITVQNHQPQSHAACHPYDERTSNENTPPTWSSAQTTIASPPRVRNVSSYGSGQGSHYHQGSHRPTFRVHEKDYSRTYKREPTTRNDYDTIMDGRSSYHGQEEQRDRPEYITVQNHQPQSHAACHPYDERTSNENTPPTWSSAQTTIASPPRVRNVSSYGSGQGSHYHQGSHRPTFRVHEKDYSRKYKREPTTYPMQTRHYNINEARPQRQRPLVPLYGHRSVGHPSLGIHHLCLPPRFLPMLDQSKFKLSSLSISFHD